MKVLFVSNLYPPQHVGGYEIRCAQVAEALAARGALVRVVTSDIELEGSVPAIGSRPPFTVDRVLGHYQLERTKGRPYTLAQARRQIRDVRAFAAILDEFRPDVVAWWNMQGLTKSLLPLPAGRSIADVCFIDDCWMITEFGASGERDSFRWFQFWHGDWGPAPLRPAIRSFVRWWQHRLRAEHIPTRPFRLDPDHVCFVSEFLQWKHEVAGLRPRSAQVIYGGVPADRFVHRRRASAFDGDPLRLLYVGYLSRDRGLRAAIEAFGHLPPPERERLTLTVAYGGPVHETSFTGQLKARILELGLGDRVSFRPRVPHHEMPALYRAHQVLVFPSERGEGMPMTMMEAAASGAAVITTGSGGSVELADRAGMPLFPIDHPVALSRLLRRLLHDRSALSEIASCGQQVVLESFTFDRMVDEIESTLSEVAARAAARPFQDRG